MSKLKSLKAEDRCIRYHHASSPSLLPARPPARLPAGLCPHPLSCAHGSEISPHFPRTLALGHTGRAIKVSACISWAAGAEVLAEVWLVGAHGTADTAMGAGVVVVAWGALDCRQEGRRHELRRVVGKWASGQWMGRTHSSWRLRDQRPPGFFQGPTFPSQAII